MTIKECIDIVDNMKPNQYEVEDKVRWLSFLDRIVIIDVLQTHENYDEKYNLFEGYSNDNLSAKLIVDAPFDQMYIEFLKMKIDEANGETARYNNSATMFNSYMSMFRKWYNKKNVPLQLDKIYESTVVTPLDTGTSQTK
jgi:uncharacterized protein YfbU (UPF0304 family)